MSYNNNDSLIKKSIKLLQRVYDMLNVFLKVTGQARA